MAVVAVVPGVEWWCCGRSWLDVQVEDGDVLSIVPFRIGPLGAWQPPPLAKTCDLSGPFSLTEGWGQGRGECTCVV